MAESSPEEQQEKFVKYLKERQAYAEKCKSGYKPISNYLDLLYSNLDGLMDIPAGTKDAEKIKGAHSKYKASLKSAKDQISNYTELDKLVKKVLSGSISSEEEGKQIVSGIDEAYNSVVGAALGLYQFLEPRMEVKMGDVPIKSVYYQLAQAKNMDLKSKFEQGLTILKRYYVTEEMVKKLIDRAQQQSQQQQAQAGA